MNWLKAAAGEFVSELSKDAKEQLGGAVDEDGEGEGEDKAPAKPASPSKTPTPGYPAATAKAVAPERPAPPIPAVSAKPLEADEDMFDWDEDSDDDASKTPAAPAVAKPAELPVAEAPQPSVALSSSSTEAALASLAPPSPPQSEREAVREAPRSQTVVATPDVAAADHASPDRTVSSADTVPAVDSSSSSAAHEALREELERERQVAVALREEADRNQQAARLAEEKAHKLAERCRMLEGELEAQKRILTEVRAAHAQEVAECDAREAETVRQLEAATSGAGDQIKQVTALLREAKERERVLEEQLRERDHAKAAAKTASEAELASLRGHLEEESRQRAQIVAESETLRSALRDREQQIAQRTAEASAGSTRSCPSDGASSLGSAECAAILQDFSAKLAAAQAEVLRVKLQSLGAGAGDVDLKAWKVLSTSNSSRLPGMGLLQAPLDDDIGWGSDEDS